MPPTRRTIESMRSSAILLDDAAARFPEWVRWVTSVVTDGYPSGGGQRLGSSNEVSDPTFAAVVARRQYGDLIARAERLADDILAITRQLEQVMNSAPPRIDIAAAKRAARCSGAVDPLCERLADGQRHKSGLCDACWMRRYRDEQRSA
jgi:hypothetical protein